MDSDFSGNRFDLKSTTGYVFELAAGSISWGSNKKTIFALYTSEAGYVALSTTSLEVIWLKTLAGDVGLVSSGLFCFNGDSQTSLQMTQDTRLTEATKHISIYYHCIRDKVQQGNIVLKYVPSEEIFPDFLNKVLGGKDY